MSNENEISCWILYLNSYGRYHEAPCLIHCLKRINSFQCGPSVNNVIDYRALTWMYTNSKQFKT